jgi:hypothetical protein
LTASSASGISDDYPNGERGTKADMAQEPDDPDTAADRLEVALERIAHLAAMRPVAPDAPRPDSDLSIPELAERLDSLIGRLRAALVKPEAFGKPE